MIKGKDFLLIGIQPWSIKIGSNFKNIAYELSKNNRVVYVNLPLPISVLIKDKITRHEVVVKKKEDLIQVNDKLYVYTPKTFLFSINWLKPGYLYNILNKENAKKYAVSLINLLNELDFKNYILLNDSLMFIGKYLKEYLQPSFFLYYIRDNLVEQPYFKKHGTVLESETIKSADAVIANSEFLTSYARRFNSNSYMIGQGCDLENFDETKNKIEPNPFFKNIPSPIIGYVGNLTSTRLDIKLLEGMAQERPQWHFVLVGPEDEDFKRSDLHKQANVHFTGIRPSEELPSWIKGFHICLNPQLVNSNTIGNYPRKIDEYLAVGKPIVATDTLAMQYFKEYVYLGNDVSSYIRMIEKALEEDHEELSRRRKAFASHHSWNENVKTIYSIILKHKKDS